MKMDEATVKEAIEAALPALKNGERVVIIPVKDGLRVVVEEHRSIFRTPNRGDGHG